MWGNVNEQGQTFASLAMKGRNDYSVLPSKAYEQFESTEKRITALWIKSSDEERRRVVRYVGVMSRYGSFLLQVRRLADHAIRLIATVRQPSHPIGQGIPLSIGWAANEICSDFESLLFHGRAALDKLTHTINAEYGDKSFRFSRLKNVLSDHADDKRANRLVSVLDRATQVSGTLVNLDDRVALRSMVAHYGSITENPRHCFSLHSIPGKRLIIFDCESLRFPVMTTAHRLSQWVPFVIGNALAIYLGCKQLQADAFAPSWLNPTVVYTDYLSEGEGSHEFSVFRMNPDGFTVENNLLDSAVMDKAISLVESK